MPRPLPALVLFVLGLLLVGVPADAGVEVDVGVAAGTGSIVTIIPAPGPTVADAARRARLGAQAQRLKEVPPLSPPDGAVLECRGTGTPAATAAADARRQRDWHAGRLRRVVILLPNMPAIEATCWLRDD